MAILRSYRAALIHDSNALRISDLRKQVFSYRRAHRGHSIGDRSKKRTGLGSHPWRAKIPEKRAGRPPLCQEFWTLNPGDTNKTISVAACGDTLYEPNE